jgi:hypothetical protein
LCRTDVVEVTVGQHDALGPRSRYEAPRDRPAYVTGRPPQAGVDEQLRPAWLPKREDVDEDDAKPHHPGATGSNTPSSSQLSLARRPLLYFRANASRLRWGPHRLMKVRQLIFARLSISSLTAGERLAKPTFAAMVVKQLKMRDRTRPYRTRKHRA